MAPAAGVAATLNAFTAEEWPCVWPVVAIVSVPRIVFRAKARTAAVDVLKTTSRSPATRVGTPKISNGSWVPLWMLSDEAMTVPPELTRKRS